MKNKIKCLVILGFLVSLFFSFLPSVKPVSNLLLENIEALGADESGGVLGCAGLGSLDCPYSTTKSQYIIRY